MELVPPFVPPLVDHTRYFRHASARLRVETNMFVLTCDCVAVCVLRRPMVRSSCNMGRALGQVDCEGYRSATSTHETISSSIEPSLLLSGANY